MSPFVDAGYVTLSGKVTMPFKASDIEKRVAKVDGVKGVRNTIAAKAELATPRHVIVPEAPERLVKCRLPSN
jgi:hypothetical protein